MKRRNFLKLFPFAGFAAVLGAKLKAEPELQLPDVRGVVLKDVTPDDELIFDALSQAGLKGAKRGKELRDMLENPKSLEGWKFHSMVEL